MKGDIFLAADLWRDKNNQTKKKVENTFQQKDPKAVTGEQKVILIDKEILGWRGLFELLSPAFG
ncbi:hypothetical protein A4V04_09425 [Burkholderiales bacterium YL45]|uniref:Uncharacterized protein n=1 Tax=Turicimonas muris TaxID=1796652 RepID=A0A227KHH1_9BURK|nr:hypothetical protein A4V04_09425 [Burkholderiales bacterium YL45]OXE47260.1 hypothetical protein ADH67_08860 [Turicimonas muris]